MYGWRNLWAAAAFLALLNPIYGQQDKKDSSSSSSSGGALSRLRQLFSRNPSNTSGTKTPNESRSNQARQGFDTPDRSPNPVKADDKNKKNQSDMIKSGNKQYQQEQNDTARRFPPIGKEPPSPGSGKSTNNSPPKTTSNAGNSANANKPSSPPSNNKPSPPPRQHQIEH
jgi:hypothetical protein